MRPIAPSLALLASLSLVARGARADPPAPSPAPPPHAHVADFVHPAPASALPDVIDRPDRDTRNTPDARAAADTLAYLHRAQSEAFPQNSPGAWERAHTLGADIAHEWHPPAVLAPGTASTIFDNFVASPATSAQVGTLSLGAFATSRTGGAADDLDRAHPNSDIPRPANLGSAIAEVHARTVRADIEIDHAADGHLVAVRLLHASGNLAFDRRALEAARAGAMAETPHAVAGGWRSRWAFEQVNARDPLFIAQPAMPGDSGRLTPLWFEATSDGEYHGPLLTHRRHRVRLLSSERLDGQR